MIAGWEVLRSPPTKDDKGKDIPLAQRLPSDVIYKGVRGKLSPAGVNIIWPEQPDLHGLVFMPDKAAPIIDWYLGDRQDWPFKWLRIIPLAERLSTSLIQTAAVPEADPAVDPAPQPVQSVTTPPPPVKPKRLTAKEQAKFSAYQQFLSQRSSAS